MIYWFLLKGKGERGRIKKIRISVPKINPVYSSPMGHVFFFICLEYNSNFFLFFFKWDLSNLNLVLDWGNNTPLFILSTPLFDQQLLALPHINFKAFLCWLVLKHDEFAQTKWEVQAICETIHAKTIFQKGASSQHPLIVL